MRFVIASILVISLLGLGYVQYRLLINGLQLSKVKFDYQIAQVMKVIRSDIAQENRLTYLLMTVVTRDSTNFTANLDTVRDASLFYFDDYLRNKFLDHDIPIDFSFTLKDRVTGAHYLQSTDFELGHPEYSYYEVNVEGAIARQCLCTPVLMIRVHHLLRFLLSKLNTIIITSLIFLSFILFSFIWLIWLLAKVQRLDKVKNDFINNLTHEIKTPVFSISLATKVLEEMQVSTPMSKYLGLIRKETEKLKTHIDAVLGLATLENPKNIMELTEQDVHPLLESVVHYFEEKVLAQHGTIIFESHAEQTICSVNASHLSNAVVNILDNALKYSQDSVYIKLYTYNEGQTLNIAIEDQGRGIEPEELKRIFNKFYRVPLGDLHDVKGFGIGLNYVNQVVKRHKGDIKVKSIPGKGSTFIINLPLSKG